MTEPFVRTIAVGRPYASKRAVRMTLTIARAVADRLAAAVPEGQRSAFVEASIAAALDLRDYDLGRPDDHPAVAIAKTAVHLQDVGAELLALAGALLRERSQAAGEGAE